MPSYHPCVSGRPGGPASGARTDPAQGGALLDGRGLITRAGALAQGRSLGLFLRLPCPTQEVLLWWRGLGCTVAGMRACAYSGRPCAGQALLASAHPLLILGPGVGGRLRGLRCFSRSRAPCCLLRQRPSSVRGKAQDLAPARVTSSGPQRRLWLSGLRDSRMLGSQL